MSDRLIFNHHSLPYLSSEQAVAAMPEFLAICLKASRLGFRTILLDEGLDVKWFRIQLAPGYYWQDWYNVTNRNGADRELIRRFLSISTTSPLFSCEDIGTDLELFDVNEANSTESLSALRAAAWYDLPMVSYPTRIPWGQNPVFTDAMTLDSVGDLRHERRAIVNWFSLSTLAQAEAKLREEREVAVRSGSELWSNRDSLFAYLQFCGSAPTQLQNWSHRLSILSQVRSALSALSRFAEQWQASEIAEYSHDSLRSVGISYPVSGESPSVHNMPSKRAEREFWLNKGRKELFENHIKLSHGFRVHFFPDPGTREIHIGYIGPHLTL